MYRRRRVPRDGGIGDESSAIEGIRHWFTLLLVAFFVGPMYVSNLWGYMQSRRYLTEAAFVNIGNVAALEAAETREFVRAAEGVVSSIVAGNHYMFQLIRLLRDTDEDRELVSGALQGHLAAKAAEGASFREYLILSPSGRLLASSMASGVLDSDLSGHRCFQTGISKVSTMGFEVSEEGHGPGPNGQTHSHSEGGATAPAMRRTCWLPVRSATTMEAFSVSFAGASPSTSTAR